MQIHDFHAKLKTEEGDLFEALRSLTEVEDLTAMLEEDPGIAFECQWVDWPPIGSHTSGAASALFN